MGTVRPASPAMPLNLLPIDGVCPHPLSGSIKSDRGFAILAKSDPANMAKSFPKYEVKNVPWRPNLRFRLVLMYRKTVGGDLFVCPYGLSGSNAFTEKDGMLYQDLNKARLIEFRNVKIVCKNLKCCKDQLNDRCNLLGKPVDRFSEVPHIFAIRVDILGVANLAPYFTEDIFDPDTYGFGQFEQISPEGALNPDGGEKLILVFNNLKLTVKNGVIYGRFDDPGSHWFEEVEVRHEDISYNTIKFKTPSIPMDEGDEEKLIPFKVQSGLGATSNTIDLLFRRKQSHIGTTTESTIFTSSSPSENVLPNDPKLDGQPTAWPMPSITPETIEVDDQPMEDSVKMPTMQSPLEVFDYNEEPDNFQPGVQSGNVTASNGTPTPSPELSCSIINIDGQLGLFVPIGPPQQDAILSTNSMVEQGVDEEVTNVSPEPNMAAGSQAKLPFPNKVTLSGPYDTLEHNRAPVVYDTVSPVPSTSTDSGKVENEKKNEEVMKRGHPNSEDEPDIVPLKKPYDREDACGSEWSTATLNARSLEVELEKQLRPLFDLSDNLPYYN